MRNRAVLITLMAGILSILMAGSVAAEPLEVLNVTSLNSTYEDTGFAQSNNPLEAIFHSRRPGGLGGADLYRAERPSVYSDWQSIENISELNSEHDDYEAKMRSDGLEIFFVSTRPGGKGGPDIWVSTRVSPDAVWSATVPVSELNSAYDDAGPYLSADGLTIYFHSTRSGGPGWNNIYIASRPNLTSPFGLPVIVPGINSSGGECMPCLSPDGLTLYFASDQPGGKGDWDIWRSTHPTKESEWSAPENLPCVNTAYREFSPFFSSYENALYFESTRPGGLGDKDIWLASIGEERPKFLTLPFIDPDIKIQQGWVYTWDPDPEAHKGIDYIKTIGWSSSWQPFAVVAAADGVAMQSYSVTYGVFVLIRHNEKDNTGNNYLTLYAHLDSVASGIPLKDKYDTNYSNWKSVKRGDLIGIAGNTGAPDIGIHLHFEVQRKAYVHYKTDPYDLYTTRDFYPQDEPGCGPNHLWNTDPPTTADGIVAEVHSPVELRVYDSHGRITGLQDGEEQNEIPHSTYFENTVTICLPTDTYYYEVVGTEEGIYGLDITSIEEGNSITFEANDIPTSLNAIHQYTTDWEALSAGEEGVILDIDDNGDGVFEKIVIADNDLTYDEFILQTETLIDFEPDTLNLKSEGKVVTVYIELPEGFDVSEIDISSVMLNDLVPALSEPIEIGDYDSDGITDLMVKFDRQELVEILEPGEEIITLTGRLTDGTRLAGTDKILVIH